jgi:hypothetical protein
MSRQNGISGENLHKATNFLNLYRSSSFTLQIIKNSNLLTAVLSTEEDRRIKASL